MMLLELPVMPQRYVEYCTYPGCFAHTREGKPFCIDHVLEHDYPRQIQEAIANREAELERIKNDENAMIDVRGSVARDVLTYLLDVSTATVERIARERGLKHNVCERIVDALAGSGLVELGRTKRGSKYAKFVKLPPPLPTS